MLFRCQGASYVTGYKSVVINCLKDYIISERVKSGMANAREKGATLT